MAQEMKAEEIASTVRDPRFRAVLARDRRADGAELARHALAVAIPCHRVVRSDGALSGYRWGVERKRVLLAREAAS